MASSWIAKVVGLLLVSLVLSYVIIPWAIERFSKFRLRVKKLSIFSARGLEWRSKAHANSPEPDLRIDHIYWSWGGCSPTSIVTLHFDGITVRARKHKHKSDKDHESSPKKKKRLPPNVQRVVNNLVHMVVHHWSRIATRIGVSVQRIRVIMEDHGQSEILIGGIVLSSARKTLAPLPQASDKDDLSAGKNCTKATASKGHRRRGSLANLQSIQDKVSKTASNLWSSAVGYGVDHVVFTLTMSNVDAVQPLPLYSSHSDNTITTSLPHLSPRTSTTSMSSTKSARTSSFTTFDPINSLLNFRTSPDAKARSYEKIATIDTATTVKVSVGFAANHDILAEDNIRADVQVGTIHASIDALEKARKIIKEKTPVHKEEVKEELQQPQHKDTETEPAEESAKKRKDKSLVKALLRASERTSISFSKVYVSHALPVTKVDSPPGSSSESSTTVVENSDAGSAFTLSLDFTNLCLTVAGTNSNEDPRLRKLYGKNESSESLLRGVSVCLYWTSIELQCISPGESSNEKIQLVAIRKAEFDLLSSWRPMTSVPSNLLFADDLNQFLIYARGSIASVDVATDVQLCEELVASWRSVHPPKEKKHPKHKRHFDGIPPRVVFLVDIGHISMVVANRASENSATVTLACDGLTMGTHTEYKTLSGKAKARASPASSTATTPSVKSGRQPGSPTSVKSAKTFRSTSSRTSTTKVSGDSSNADTSNEIGPDDYSLVLKGEGFVNIDPIQLRLSLGSRNERSFRLAHLGPVNSEIFGDIRGVQKEDENGRDRYSLCPESFLADGDITVEEGLRLEIWSEEVVDAIRQLAGLRTPKEHKQSKPSSDPLDKLPVGLSLRADVPLSIFLGHKELNPAGAKLVHGIWFTSHAVVDYASYGPVKRDGSSTKLPDADARKQLGLYTDIRTTAAQDAKALKDRDGQSALFAFTLLDTNIKPVLNGSNFIEKGGTDLHMPEDEYDDETPPEPSLEYAAWGFKGNRRREQPGIRPTILPPADVAPRSTLRLPRLLMNARLVKTTPSDDSSANVSVRMDLMHFHITVADIYCFMLGGQTLKDIAEPFKKPKPKPEEGDRAVAKRKRYVKVVCLMPNVWADFALPLRERVFLTFSNLGVNVVPNDPVKVTSDSVLLYVQSRAHPGYYDELGLIKQLNASIDMPSRVIGIDAAAFRIRIPYAFVLYQLIFNINVTIKTCKLLAHNFKSKEFSQIKMPGSEQPKYLPTFKINVGLFRLEFRDHPVENKLNLANRVGLVEQKKRIGLEDMFEHKVSLLNDEDVRSTNHLTTNATVSEAEARYRLDWHMSQSWIKRMKRATAEQNRREEAINSKMKVKRPNDLPIHILPLEQTTPLFRASFSNVKLTLAAPPLNREQIINFMSNTSTPFDKDVQFSLMVPFELDWTQTECKITLRDYPLPLLRVPPKKDGTPSWHVTTLLVIAEELPQQNLEDTCLFVPVEILPAQSGHVDAPALRCQVAKTITPVKTYARPIISVTSDDPATITWCNSYQPGISDVMKVLDGFSSPPRDPSPKPGFWDKMRLSLHWITNVEFSHSLRLLLKGSQDPYQIDGTGAGFALVFRSHVRIQINEPNDQHELIQFLAEEALVSIPDLTNYDDKRAVGLDAPTEGEGDGGEADRRFIEKRSIKPCARFLNGIRFGVGFRFERTCRPWSCQKNCGDTTNLFHRRCRIFNFIPHQAVRLRRADVVEKMSAEAGHPVDSYEGFRSDFIHFSISLDAPRDRNREKNLANAGADNNNSLYLSPKAFAHFFSWWHLFTSKIPAPIRQGPVFPDSPPPSKKFGKSMATIKYRTDLSPVYVQHGYFQWSQQLWSTGRAEHVGVKLRVDRFRLDGHQRMTERRVWQDKLQRVKTVVNKPFYACDLILDVIRLKGMVSTFDEMTTLCTENPLPADLPKVPHASELPAQDRQWYSWFDYIDADHKPFDRNPRVLLVHLGDCPHVFLSRRVKARLISPHEDPDAPPSDLGATKFGHEKTHICYLGAAMGVGPMQTEITQTRIIQLEGVLSKLPPPFHGEPAKITDGRNLAAQRINVLQNHIADLRERERRHMDDNTFIQEEDQAALDADKSGDVTFENTIHVHSPRLFFNNVSRNLIYKYLYSRQNRRKEEYTTSYESLKGLRDGMNKRMNRKPNGLNADDLPADPDSSTDAVQELQETLEKLVDSNSPALYKLPSDFFSDKNDLRRPEQGLPAECTVHPHWQAVILKPQVSLRSTADVEAVVLVAMEEINYRDYSVQDTKGEDHVSTNVLDRDYISFQGLQAFYPTNRIAKTKNNVGNPNFQLDFVPLEIFVDSKCEANDYERIVLKTDISMSMDRFNQLRPPRGLEWPETRNEAGELITHLRKHQNETSITIPMITVSATSVHYSALYYIVTDLLLYRDPQDVQRSAKIESFLYKFDRRDRNPQQLLLSLFVLQQHIRNLNDLQRGYEMNMDRLNENGKRELFQIRSELLNEYESLFTIFAVVNVNRSRDQARAMLKTLSKIDIRAGNVAWHMLRDNGDPLLKLNIKHTIASRINNQDASSDHALVIGDLAALNTNADALFPEVFYRTAMKEAPKSKSKSKKKKDDDSDNDKRNRDGSKPNSSISMAISWAPEVGGIKIVREGTLFLHPCRFRLEEEVGSSVMAYIFRPKKGQEETQALENTPTTDNTTNTTNMVSTKNSDTASTHDSISTSTDQNSVNATINERLRCKTALIAGDRFTHRQTNQKNGDAVSVHESSHTHGSSHAHGHGHGSNHAHGGDESDSGDEDGAEMRNRAKNNFTFVSVVMGSTTFVLDYKRDDHRKHSTISMPECVDFRFDVPSINYENKVWTAEDLVNHLKVDIMKSMWHQRSDIIKQVFHKTSIFRSKKGLRQIAGIETQSATAAMKKEQKKSALRYKESALEPLDIDDALSPQITHDLDPKMPEHGSRSVSPTATANPNTRHQRGPSATSDPSVYESPSEGQAQDPDTSVSSSTPKDTSSTKDSPTSPKDSASSQKSHKGHGLGSLLKSGIRKVKEHHHHHDKDKDRQSSPASPTAPTASRSTADQDAMGEAACMLDRAGAEDLTPPLEDAPPPRAPQGG